MHAIQRGLSQTADEGDIMSDTIRHLKRPSAEL